MSVTGTLTVAITAAALQPIQHVPAALDRLPLQFEDKPNVIAILTALISPMQSLEDALVRVILQRSVLNATGVTLARLGKLVGQANTYDDTDDVYRRYVSTRIAANKSRGLGEDLIKIARLILNTDEGNVLITDRGGGSVTIRITGIEIDADVANVLINFYTGTTTTTSAGVRAILETSDVPDGMAWTFGDSAGDQGPDDNTGMGDTSDPTVGGELISVIDTTGA